MLFFQGGIVRFQFLCNRLGNLALYFIYFIDNGGKITAIGNTADIVAADISATNGIIHVINAVILPIVP
jgi:uncharacterized surface protein with fasciclin (FAS1) repeats